MNYQCWNSCQQIFMDLNTLTLYSLHINWTSVLHWKKQNLEQNAEVHNYSIWKCGSSCSVLQCRYWKKKMCGEYENEIMWQDIWLYERMGQVDLLKGSGDPVWCILQICFTILDLNSHCPTCVSLWSWRRTIFWDRWRLDWVLGYLCN